MPTAAELLGPLNSVEQKYAPRELWYEGDASLLRRHPRVAIVGTRKPSEDGQRRARQLARDLAKASVVVVSGLAEGIDTIAHTTAIESRDGRTIAVLGTPLTDVYPRSNAALQQRIGHEHLLVSEFPPKSAIARGNFVRRNRTMALVADASVIVEAGEGSGTLSQGWEVLRLGRPLFLMRSLFSSGLKWPDEMRGYGARVLENVEDVLAELPTIDSDVHDAVAF